MNKLPEEILRFGNKLKLVKRSDHTAIYGLFQRDKDRLFGYEVFRIQSDESGEQFVSSGQFGSSHAKSAWYFALVGSNQKKALARANEKFAELEAVSQVKQIETV